MSTVIYHNHHIIPRHAGGSNDPSNLIKLTIPEPAEAHRVLWETHGRIQDKVAWLMLSGKTNESEAAFRELYHQTGLLSKGRKHSPEAKAKIGAANKKSKRPDLAAYNRKNKTGKTIVWSADALRKRSIARKEFFRTQEGIEHRRQASERMKANNPMKKKI